MQARTLHPTGEIHLPMESREFSLCSGFSLSARCLPRTAVGRRRNHFATSYNLPGIIIPFALPLEERCSDDLLITAPNRTNSLLDPVTCNGQYLMLRPKEKLQLADCVFFPNSYGNQLFPGHKRLACFYLCQPS